MDYIGLNRTRQLLVDDHIIEDRGDTCRIIHSWEKETHPVMVKELDWEGVGPYAMNAVAFDPIDDSYKMWYGTFDSDTRRYNGGFAESQDGLDWRRHPEMIPEEACGTVVIDPRAGEGEYRYLSLGYCRPSGELPGRGVMRRSQDGVNWEAFPGDPWWFGPSDVINVLWDSRRECFVSYHKLWRVSGRTEEGEAVNAFFPTFLPTQDDKRGIMRIEGRELFPEARPVVYELVNEAAGSHDGGGGNVSKDVSMLRVIGRAESKDFIHWTNHAVVLEPTNKDPIDVQFYGMPVFEYEGVYLALPRYFEGISGRMDAQFACSRDGVRFAMPDTKRVLACGPQGSWDGGMVFSTPNILEISGRLCMYYGAMDVDHTKPEAGTVAAIGRAWLRKDGFASLTGGTARTRLLHIEGDSIYINAQGEIGIRLLDSGGGTIGAAVWEGDSVGALVELGGTVVSNITGYLEFDLSHGALYSFWSD